MAGKTFEMELDASPDRVWTAMVHTVANLGYTMLASDAQTRVLSFNTGRSMKTWGGQDLSATLIEASPGKTRVVMGGSLAKTGNPFGGGAQIGAWGEKKALINKTLAAVEELLPTIPQSLSNQTATTGAQEAADSLDVKLKNLVELMEKGALTDEEFQVAKAKLLTAQ